MDYNSFKKGEEFEKYVERHLFHSKDYTLISRTNSFEQNRERYSEDTMKPDFKFKCIKSQEEFYVEAKYRSGFNYEDKLDVMSAGQLARFHKLQNTEQIPIYVVIGYQGYPSNPAYVSLIPISELIYLELYASFLNKFKIEKGSIDFKTLRFSDHIKVERSSTNTSEFISESREEKAPQKNKVFKFSKLVIGLIVLLFVGAIGLYFLNAESNIEEKLRERTFAYYQKVESNDIEGLEEFLNPVVYNWYDKSNMTMEQIKRDARTYHNRFSNSTTEIQWDSFEVTPLSEDYLVTYKLIYKIGSEGKFKNKIFHLKIRAIWSENLKIKSLTEERI